MCAAAALANLDIIEKEGLLDNVRNNQEYFRAQLETLLELDLVGDVRGDGYFFGIEMVKDKKTRMIFSDEESDYLIRDFLSGELFRNGLYCRADDRGEPVIQVAPPLTIGRPEIDEIVAILRKSLVAAQEYLVPLYVKLEAQRLERLALEEASGVVRGRHSRANSNAPPMMR
jgi:adenosylmethionine-8-amino-7-oxononanoate aminotransferase